MKALNKNQDGYILAYVLVVILVVSLVAVAACTTALKNYEAQNAALKYTRDKYEAEGVVEVFVLELQKASIDYAKSLEEKVTAEELDSAITGIIGTDEKSGDGLEAAVATGVFSTIRKEYASDKYFVTVEDKNDSDSNEFNAKFESHAKDALKTDGGSLLNPIAQPESEDEGNAYYDICIKCRYNGIEVSADVRLSFPVKKGGGEAIVYGVLFEYTSYSVSGVAKGGTS